MFISIRVSSTGNALAKANAKGVIIINPNCYALFRWNFSGTMYEV